MKTSAPIRFLLLALALAALAPARAMSAPERIIVFDIEPSGAESAKWMAPALTDFMAKLLDASGKFHPAPLADVRRAVIHAGLPFGDIPYEKKDAIREKLHSNFIAEGAITLQNNQFVFKGSVADLGAGTLNRDISFRTAAGDIFKVEAAFQKTLVRVLNLKVVPGAALSRRLLGTKTQSAYENYWKGLYRYESGDTNGAVSLIDKALHADGNFIPALLALGRIQTERTRYRDALGVLSHAVRIAPDNDEAQFLLGLAYFFMRDSLQAGPHFQEAVRLRPNVAEYRLQWAQFLEDARRQPQALFEYQNAVDLDPAMPEAWYRIAVIQARNRNEKLALDALEQAIRAGGDAYRKRAAEDRDFDVFRGPRGIESDKDFWNRRFLRLVGSG